MLYTVIASNRYGEKETFVVEASEGGAAIYKVLFKVQKGLTRAALTDDYKALPIKEPVRLSDVLIIP